MEGKRNGCGTNDNLSEQGNSMANQMYKNSTKQ